ncbi:MAG: hypothetical protein M3203_03860, partial [Actinomycetota bacterium]|nr:hypothetical protein [Actinomycetota bacterium]
MPRRCLPFLVALVAWAATACHVSIATGIDVARDGTGRVTAGVGLDADAVRELGDPATAFRVDDLRRAGWQVEGPRKEDDGLTWVRASKPFADPDQAGAAMAELSGPAGPFRDFRLVRTRSLLRSKTTFAGTVDLSLGLVGLSDAELDAALGDVPLGLDLEGLRSRFGDELGRAVKVQVAAGLPGEVTTNAPAREGGRAVWSPQLGQTVELEASSEALRVSPVVAIGAGGAVLVVVVALFLV